MPRARGRQEFTKKAKVLGYRNEMAARLVTSSPGERPAEEHMSCSFGKTEWLQNGERQEVFYANGEVSGSLRITVTGKMRDAVNMAFESAIARLGFEVQDGKDERKKPKADRGKDPVRRRSLAKAAQARRGSD